MLSRLLRAATLIAIALFATTSTDAQTKLLRFPDIAGDRVVFSYGGDLWTASTSGGTATRLTTHPGVEVFAKFSPDGKWIAFTGQYDGDEQVYVIPATGGVPRQLTFYPARGPLTPRWGWDNQVLWLERRRQANHLQLAARFVDASDRATLHRLGRGRTRPSACRCRKLVRATISPDGTRMVYSPQSRDFRPEKRYGGGQANQLYIFDLKSYDANASPKVRPSRDAMWIGDTIYFNSDRDGHFNLYAYNVSGGKTTQVTNSKQWDVRWPSSDQRKPHRLRNGWRVAGARRQERKGYANLDHRSR